MAAARFMISRMELWLWRGRLFRALGGEGNVPYAGFPAGVDDQDHFLVYHVAVAAQADWLVFENLDHARELFLEFFQCELFAFHDHRAIGADVDQDFASDA